MRRLRARLAVLAEQHAAKLRASHGQPRARDEALLEKIPPKTDNVPKFHLADVRLPAGVVDRCRVCDAGIPTKGWYSTAPTWGSAYMRVTRRR